MSVSKGERSQLAQHLRPCTVATLFSHRRRHRQARQPPNLQSIELRVLNVQGLNVYREDNRVKLATVIEQARKGKWDVAFLSDLHGVRDLCGDTGLSTQHGGGCRVRRSTGPAPLASSVPGLAEPSDTVAPGGKKQQYTGAYGYLAIEEFVLVLGKYAAVLLGPQWARQWVLDGGTATATAGGRIISVPLRCGTAAQPRWVHFTAV